MAIYHLSATIISRSQGRSAVASAAYRSAERLKDERQNKTHNYTHKKDVAHTEIFLPENAPLWMSDRSKLWNAVEACEKRYDSQLAREFNFSLPLELSLEQQITLASDFVKKAFVSKGMVADLAIHNDLMEDGTRQPHAHVMLTLREVEEKGFGRKAREWNSKENLLQWREEWSSMVNAHLFLHGHDVKVDHRTLEAQGIDLQPQHRIGPKVAKEFEANVNEHQRIAKENGEALLQNPEIALKALTQQQSTFTREDVKRFVHRHSVDEDQFNTLHEKIMSLEDIVVLGVDNKQRLKYTTYTILEKEVSLFEQANQLMKNQAHSVSQDRIEKINTTYTLSEEQTLAFHHLVDSGDLKTVVGYAGTGKSYLLGAARQAWESQGYHVHGVTLSGIAAENLESGSAIASRTLASRSYFWDKGEEALTAQDILVVDEAGMMGTYQLEKILAEANKHHAKVVLVGDSYQLQAIEAGSPFRAISEYSPRVLLQDVRRQEVSWQKEATVKLATGKTQEALNDYISHAHVHAFTNVEDARKSLVNLWNDARLNKPEESQLILTYTRTEVALLNKAARSLRRALGELGKDQRIETANGEKSFAQHDRVYFLANDKALGVKNGSLGSILSIKGNTLEIRLDGTDAKAISFDTRRYNQLTHGYAATIHKAQGVTVDRAYILASRYMNAHSSYVAFSRHRKSLDIFYNQKEFANEEVLGSILSRERAKELALDYHQPQTSVSSLGVNAPELEAPQHLAYRFPSDTLSMLANKEKMLADSKACYERIGKQTLHGLPDFKDFQKEFEAKNPALAKTLRDEVWPDNNRLSLDLETYKVLFKKQEQQALHEKRQRLEDAILYNSPEKPSIKSIKLKKLDNTNTPPKISDIQDAPEKVLEPIKIKVREIEMDFEIG